VALDLTDQTARDRILTDLDRNLLVQAGAGAGKTHALIGRMVEVVRTGRQDVQHMAAITFTKKAAGEMKSRFHSVLRETLAATPDSDPSHRRLSDAIDRIDQCYIGTIHAFCARLLRERPLEAGLPPDFSELDERAEWVSLREAWSTFVLDRYAKRDDRLDRFDAWGIRPEDFFDFFVRRSEFSDLDLHWTDVPPASLTEPAEIAKEWVESVSQWIPDPLVEKPDRLQDALRRATSFLRNRGMETERDERYFLSLLDLKSSAVTLKRWAPHQDKARDIRDNGLPELLETVVRPALAQWRRSIYPDVAAFVDEAVEHHRQSRIQCGVLTFQDLLEQAAALLAGREDLRRDFQDRYRCLFIDEFQDTDPLQAEILLYLAADDPSTSDWRDCRPRPGSLFLVGDEKQAIYRFRRADLDVFRDVRDRVRASGGDILDLTTSFRSLGGVCDWVNTAFEPVFSRFDPRYQATFAELSPARPTGDLPSQVMRASIPKVGGNDRTMIARQDADRIARYIGAAISRDDSVERCTIPEPVTAGDFMVLTRTTGHLDTYARALERFGIPFTIEGSGKLRASEELRDLIQLLEIVHTPGNPIPLVGYLRGRLIGLGDDELFAHKDAGGAFDYRTAIPDALNPGTAARLELAYEHIQNATKWLQTEPVSVAIKRILDTLELLPFSALRPMGSSRAGNLIRILELVRRWEGEDWHWTEVLRELQELRDDPEYKLEELTLDSGNGASVRLMNLHQAKGLQARVVFLADPYDTSFERHDPDFHVSRSGSEPRLTLPVYRTKGAHGKELISEPHGWEHDAEEECRFLDAEERRLVYVAATRAEDLLVVSRYEGNLKKGPWVELNSYLEDLPELPDAECHPPERTSNDAPDFRAIEEDIENRWQRLRQRSYAGATVTANDDRRIRRHESEETVQGRGTEYGQWIHDLLEQVITGHMPEDISAYLSTQAQQESIDAEHVPHAINAISRFQSSTLWEEIQASKHVHTEVDFAKSDAFMGQESITRGRIDLVYRVIGGWKIVDFKTDRAATPAEAQALRMKYRDQVLAYAQYWTDLTGERVKSTGLWSTDPGTWLDVD